MRSSLLLPLLAACTSPSDDTVGPYTGRVQRYSIDRFVLPMDKIDVQAMGVDLDGDKIVDNQIGAVTSMLAGQKDLTKYGTEMIQAGRLDSWIEVQADDRLYDTTVGVRYVGAPGASFTLMHGQLVDGAFSSDAVATSLTPGAATLELPVFADADPSQVTAIAMQLSFQPDGHGGLDAQLAGVIDPMTVDAALVKGIQQMMAASPRDHVFLLDLFDANADHVVTPDEVLANTFIHSVTAPDVSYFHNSRDVLSFGFDLHLVPCDVGTCAASIASPCFDRVKDGDETDVDCGGSCGKCAPDLTCAVASDCQSNSCNGTCAPTGCSDGVKDGFEANVDCGTGCLGCAVGLACDYTTDCASKHCISGRCAP